MISLRFKIRIEKMKKTILVVSAIVLLLSSCKSEPVSKKYVTLSGKL